MTTIVTLNAGTEEPEVLGFLWHHQAERYAELSIQRSDVESVAVMQVDVLDFFGGNEAIATAYVKANKEADQ